MRLVVLESPFAGDTARNIEYGRKCLKDSLAKGEAPLASHLLYTQPDVLDDKLPWERDKGMRAGHAWLRLAEAVVVYIDFGLSPGMVDAINLATYFKIPVEYRKLQN